jgi:hypothetical protein
VHFEELWEKCENFHQEENKNEIDCQSILDALAMKVNLYRMVDQSVDAKDEEQQKAKSRLIGEILLTLTNLSLKDNINVFDALAVAYRHHTIDLYSQKYK